MYENNKLRRSKRKQRTDTSLKNNIISATKTNARKTRKNIKETYREKEPVGQSPKKNVPIKKTLRKKEAFKQVPRGAEFSRKTARNNNSFKQTLRETESIRETLKKNNYFKQTPIEIESIRKTPRKNNSLKQAPRKTESFRETLKKNNSFKPTLRKTEHIGQTLEKREFIRQSPRIKSLISSQDEQKVSGQLNTSIKWTSCSTLNSRITRRSSRNLAIDDLEGLNNSFKDANNNLKSRTKQVAHLRISSRSKSKQQQQCSNKPSDKSKKQKPPVKETKTRSSKKIKSNPLSGDALIGEKAVDDIDSGTDVIIKSKKTKDSDSKLRKRKQKNIAFEDNAITSKKLSGKKSKKTKTETLSPSTKKDKSIVLTQDHQKLNHQVNNNFKLSSSSTLNSHSSRRSSRNLAIDVFDAFDSSYRNTNHNMKSKTKTSTPLSSPTKSKSEPGLLCIKNTLSNESREGKPIVKKTKVDKLKKTKADPLGLQSNIPKKGSLKRKRWNMNMLNQKNEGYEDDIFESRKFDDLQAMFGNLGDDESDGHTSIISIATPKCGFMLSPCVSKASPAYKDCISSTELMEARKVAEEYIYRRNKKRKSDSQNESNSKTPISMSLSEPKILPEKRKLDYSEALVTVINAQKDIEKPTHDESEDEDAYFSDVSD